MQPVFRLRAGIWRYRFMLLTGAAVFLLDQITKLAIAHSGLPLGVYPPLGGVRYSRFLLDRL
jgi:hypothetical protein